MLKHNIIIKQKNKKRIHPHFRYYMPMQFKSSLVLLNFFDTNSIFRDHDFVYLNRLIKLKKYIFFQIMHKFNSHGNDFQSRLSAISKIHIATKPSQIPYSDTILTHCNRGECRYIIKPDSHMEIQIQIRIKPCRNCVCPLIIYPRD